MKRPIGWTQVWASAALCVVLVGCAHRSTSGEVGRTEARGDRYMEGGRPELAHKEYADALSDDPGDERLEGKLRSSLVAYLDDTSVHVEELLDAGDPALAIVKLHKLEEIFSEELREPAQQEAIDAMKTQVVSSSHARIRTAEQAGDFERAYMLSRALTSYYPQEVSRLSKVDVARAREAWVTQLKELGRDMEEQNLLAAASLYWLKVYDLTHKDNDLAYARDDMHRALAAHMYSVSVLPGDRASAAMQPTKIVAALQESFGQPASEDIVHQVRHVHVLAGGGAASGSTLLVDLTDLRCDQRSEEIAPNQIASPAPTIVQRCMATLVLDLVPTDGARAPLTKEEVLTEEFVHDHKKETLSEEERERQDTKLLDGLHAQAAKRAQALIARDVQARDEAILRRAQASSYAAAPLNAQVLLYWLDPERPATARALDEMEAATGFGDLPTLLSALEPQ